MSWNEIESRRQKTAEKPQSDNELETLCWLVFGAGKGADLLAKLHERFIDRSPNPHASESALRVFEAQRHLVHQLEAWTDKGKKSDAQRASKRSDGG